MTDWQIEVPHRSSDDSIASIGDAAAALPAAEGREVARALALELVLETDFRTVGEALDAIDAAGIDQRRALLDRARERAGLPTVEQAEQRAAFAAANANVGSSGPLRDGSGRIEARCAANGCRRFEPHPDFPPGAAARVNVRRWYCPQHREGHEADMQPYRSGLAYGATGAIIDLDEREREGERQRVQAESRRRQRELREAARKAEAAEHERLTQAKREQFRRESPRGLGAP